MFDCIKTKCLGVLQFSFVLVVAAIPGPAYAANELHAGAAVADITPRKWPVHLIGSFSERLADRAWDPLNVRALVLDNGSNRLGIVIVDSCYCPRSLFDEARHRASKVCGMEPQHILAAATHTHSAPPSRDRRGVKADPDYVELVTQGIVSALRQATSNLAPAELGWGSCQVPEEVHNRRWFMKPGGIVANPFGELSDQVRMNPPRNADLLDRPAGPVDPQVLFLSIRSPSGRPVALLANYSLHYVGGVPAGGVSSDYFGEFARQMADRLFPANQRDALPPFVAMLSNGTSGDVNNINFTSPRPRAVPFERIQKVASLVADRVSEALSSVKHRREVALAMLQAELELEVRKPTESEVRRAQGFLAEKDPGKLPPRALAYARWTMQLREHPGTEKIVLQAVRIGTGGLTSIPCEVFAETGLRLKRESPLQPEFTIELANGHYGYLPTPRQHDFGGYETWLGSNILEKDASTKIENTLLELLNRLAD